jgi:hypothetical protein
VYERNASVIPRASLEIAPSLPRPRDERRQVRGEEGFLAITRSYGRYAACAAGGARRYLFTWVMGPY